MANRSFEIDEIILQWELEWIEQVQSLLEMDAGWNFSGFWDMILYNLRVSMGYGAEGALVGWLNRGAE
jgi:hypothetical protein